MMSKTFTFFCCSFFICSFSYSEKIVLKSSTKIKKKAASRNQIKEDKLEEKEEEFVPSLSDSLNDANRLKSQIKEQFNKELINSKRGVAHKSSKRGSVKKNLKRTFEKSAQKKKLRKRLKAGNGERHIAKRKAKEKTAKPGIRNTAFFGDFEVSISKRGQEDLLETNE